jgi:hypothetical protein
MSRKVVLLELTCCAEEGVRAAQLRKQVRYHELVEQIGANNWHAELLTIEVGARGLIGQGAFSACQARSPPKQLPPFAKHFRSVVARCSYAICLAQDSKVWSHNTDLVLADPHPQPTFSQPPLHPQEESKGKGIRKVDKEAGTSKSRQRKAKEIK